MQEMLFTSAPQRRSRFPGLSTSVLVHAAVLLVLMQWKATRSRPIAPASGSHRYSVHIVHLQTPPEYRRRANDGAGSTAAIAQVREQVRPHATPGESSRIASAASASGERRPFKLPTNVHVQPVRQTLVQTDVPPTVTLKQEIPLPTMLLWTATSAPAMTKRFVAPPLRKESPKIVQSLPAAPALDVPNRELTPAELNIAAVVGTNTPHLVRPPAVASPVARSGQESAKVIPQIGLQEAAQPSSVNLISLADHRLRSSGMLVLPPANQVAAGDAGPSGTAGSHDAGAGMRHEGGLGTGQEALASAQGHGSGNGGGRDAAELSGGSATVAGSGSGSGTAMPTVGSGAGSAGHGSWSGSGSAIGSIPSGVTRIDLPKEGTFGVVVLGSATSARYPETVGALSGKVVYTVYLKVGLRKSWILQYCLKTAGSEANRNSRSTTPVEAPWPFLMMRPDQRGTSDPDYIIVHGSVTNEGKFDQLAMVFPEDLEKKELLMNSLKLWAFRPASRDGVPVPVEVLLIIPKED